MRYAHSPPTTPRAVRKHGSRADDTPSHAALDNKNQLLSAVGGAC